MAFFMFRTKSHEDRLIYVPVRKHKMPALKFLNWLSHVSSTILNKHLFLYNFGRTVGNMGILSCGNLAQMFGITFF